MSSSSLLTFDLVRKKGKKEKKTYFLHRFLAFASGAARGFEHGISLGKYYVKTFKIDLVSKKKYEDIVRKKNIPGFHSFAAVVYRRYHP